MFNKKNYSNIICSIKPHMLKFAKNLTLSKITYLDYQKITITAIGKWRHQLICTNIGPPSEFPRKKPKRAPHFKLYFFKRLKYSIAYSSGLYIYNNIIITVFTILYTPGLDLTLYGCTRSVQKVDDHHDTVTGVGHVVGGQPVAAQHQHGTASHLRVPPDEHHRVAGAERQPVPVSVHNRV